MSNIIPFTERPHDLTTNIDAETPEGIVQSLHKCNLEVFDGYQEYKTENSAIIISGCGTSGRIGFLATATFNQLCEKQTKSPKYKYIIAGGNRALVSSVEATEDSPNEGVRTLTQIADSYDKVLFIGITCGLAAPFVAGQLDYCMKMKEKFTPVLIGFNHVEMARKIRVTEWEKTFYDVAIELQEAETRSEEPIAGSSRMKSGTATKIILDIAFITAHASLENRHLKPSKLIADLRNVVNKMHENSTNLANTVRRAGESYSKDSYFKDNLNPEDNTNENVQLIDFKLNTIVENVSVLDKTIQKCFAETILKLALNTISTGAYILKGKVYQNIMIDLKVSNIKLFYRAVEIIKNLAQVDTSTATKCLISSIHGLDDLNKDEWLNKPVVPIALLMALTSRTYSDAKQEIDKCPKIRNICVKK
ncbi:unnamed protein product [Didymodactylos carnosus]|uniref:SIS domain-containing protein n=1 Tax=Didymodactylos carnosus TaxID=1234261 RepID=A0A814IEA8_9BILA|nr:unnamed protein product [Didymodactylos carnosus]CAF1022388.1 unnamed protein product [Didymodactylos carnosus]CAF3519444.1 unnamed protein product [Didymodactylos carnosus]CAF3793734.1 unnamed protein product [Didymodactylos carnosus]